MAAPVEVALPVGNANPVEALAQIEQALRLLDSGMPPSKFKSRIVRELALYVAEMKYQQRQTPARRHLRSHYRVVK